MRIGLLIYGSLDTLSGGYLYDRKLVEYLQRQGDWIEVISLPWRNYARHLGDNFSSSLSDRLAGLSVDVLLQDELNHPSLFWLNRRLRKRIRYPLISIVHHLRSSENRPAWQNRFYRWIERLYLSTVDGFIFNSRTTCQVVENLLAGQNILKRPSIVAWPAGNRLNPQIEDREIIRRANQPGPLRLFFLGNVILRKGLHTLLDSLKQIPTQEWDLSVGGSLETDWRYGRKVRRQAEAAGLVERVHFLGPLSDEQIAAGMKDSHVLVVPSSYEGFGIVYLEGMGFGLPAIATTGGAAREIVTHEKDGFLIPPGDSTCLAKYIRELADDRQQLAAMSLAARQRYAAHPTWDQTAARISGFIKT